MVLTPLSTICQIFGVQMNTKLIFLSLITVRHGLTTKQLLSTTFVFLLQQSSNQNIISIKYSVLIGRFGAYEYEIRAQSDL